MYGISHASSWILKHLIEVVQHGILIVWHCQISSILDVWIYRMLIC